MTDQPSRPVHAFREQREQDRAQGKPRTLADYLLLFPGDEPGVVREYFSLTMAEAGGVPEVGTQLGNYRLVSELGRGGQGRVYLAHDQVLGRDVAIKVLNGYGATNSEVLARFRREAMAASALQHPGICAVYEARVDAALPYIAMQFIAGETLAQRIAAVRRMRANSQRTEAPKDSEDIVDLSTNRESVDEPVQAADLVPPERPLVLEFAKIIEEAALALHAAHEAGVIHRDIKPGNIMITPAGQPVIMDFGLAHQDDPQAETLTRAGDLFGTPAYMSPEQLTRSAIRLDARSDVWSLGVTLYECLAMTRPFAAPTREGLYQSIIATNPQPLTVRNRNVPRDLAVVVAKALEKDRDRRYATAWDFAEDLRRVRQNEPILARQVGPLGRFVRWSRREPAKAILLCTLLLTLPTIATLITIWAKGRPLAELARTRVLQEEKEVLLADASFELSEGSAERALALFSQVAAMEGGSPEAVAGVALSRLRQKQPESAMAALDQNAALLAGSSAAILIRADALRALERTAEAEALTRSLPAPSSALDHAILGQRALMEGDRTLKDREIDLSAFERARDYATRALLLHATPRLDLLVLRCHAAGHLADLRTVQECADAMQHHYPKRMASYLWSSFGLGESDQPELLEKAVLAGKEAVRLDPSHFNAYGSLGAALTKLKRFEEAHQAAEAAVRVRPELSTAHANLGITLGELGKHREAESAFREAARLDPANEVALTNLGTVLLTLGQPEEARTWLQRALDVLPRNAPALRGMGVLHIETGRFEEAVTTLRSALALEPDIPETRTHLCRALEATGKAEEAVQWARLEVERHPNQPGSHFNIVLLLVRSGRYSEAMPHIETFERLQPGDPGARGNLALALLAAGRAAEAEEQFRKAHAIKPTEVAMGAGLGDALVAQGRHDEASAILEESIKLHPGVDARQLCLAGALEASGRIKEAIPVYREYTRAHPEDSIGHHSLGSILSNAGEHAEARTLLKEAIRLNPLSGDSHMNLGITLLHLKQYEEARRSLEEAARLAPQSALPYLHLHNVLMEQQQPEEALAAAQEAVKRDPKNADAHGMISSHWLAQGDHEKARLALEESIRQNPEDAWSHFGLGCLHLALGHWEDAEVALREAVRLRPSWPEAHCNLGHALMRQGRAGDAVPHFRLGHELGAKTEGWQYPSATWLSAAEKAAAKDQ